MVIAHLISVTGDTIYFTSGSVIHRTRRGGYTDRDMLQSVPGQNVCTSTQFDNRSSGTPHNM